MSLPFLSEHQMLQIGGGTIDRKGAKAVLGAGTGLGVAFLVPHEEGYSAHAGEGGHVSWGAKNEQEWFIYSYLKRNTNMFHMSAYCQAMDWKICIKH